MSAAVVKVSDVCDQIRGVSYSGDDAVPKAQDGYLAVLRANNITEEGLTFDDLTFVPAARISEKQLVRSGDVVIAASSGSLSVVGKAAPALTDLPMGFGAFCKVLRPNQKVAPAYFAHYFKTRDYRKKISSLAAGANINNLRNEHLDDLRFPLPPLEEQRRIAAILDQAETLRTQRRQALAHLDTLTQSLFLDMFGDPMANPKGWSFVKLDQLIREGDTINYGVIQPGDALDEGVPLVRVGDVVDGNFDPSSLKRIDPTIEAAYKRSRLRGDEILVTCVGSIGVVALVDTSMRGFNIARAVSRIPASDRVNRVFLASYLQTEHVQRYFTSELRTVSQPTLNIKQICEAKVIQPPIPLQQTFATRIQAIEALKATHRTAQAQLDALFASLQQRAFAGEL